VESDPRRFLAPAIEDALQECESCAVFVGSEGLGPWQIEEMRLAINRRDLRQRPFIEHRSRRLFRFLPSAKVPLTTFDNISPSIIICSAFFHGSTGSPQLIIFHYV
jgi:hypothetical protein